MGPETRTPGDSCARPPGAVESTTTATAAERIRPGTLQRLQLLAGAHHDPEDCDPALGAAGLCHGCGRELQQLIQRRLADWGVPHEQVLLLALLRGLGLDPPPPRAASGPELAGVQHERDGALAVLSRVARHLPGPLLRAELDAVAGEHDELLRTGIQLAILAAERAAAEKRHGG